MENYDTNSVAKFDDISVETEAAAAQPWQQHYSSNAYSHYFTHLQQLYYDQTNLLLASLYPYYPHYLPLPFVPPPPPPVPVQQHPPNPYFYNNNNNNYYNNNEMDVGRSFGIPANHPLAPPPQPPPTSQLETMSDNNNYQQQLSKDIKPPPPPPPQQLQPQSQPPVISPPKSKQIINVELDVIAPRKPGEYPVEPLPPVTKSFKDRVARIQRSQNDYKRLFGRVNSMLETLKNRYDGQARDENEMVEMVQTSSPKSATTSESTTNSDVENRHSLYPQRVTHDDGSTMFLLGPHGTQISAADYLQVSWESAQVATRTLLGCIFTSDELATHTLTGKPSPAFYGRERPPKMQLDASKVEDIVTCVRSRTGGKERNIRATITTKCADTAKKYKRRAKKAQQKFGFVMGVE